jgi:hypothetical protein
MDYEEIDELMLTQKNPMKFTLLSTRDNRYMNHQNRGFARCDSRIYENKYNQDEIVILFIGSERINANEDNENAFLDVT